MIKSVDAARLFAQALAAKLVEARDVEEAERVIDEVMKDCSCSFGGVPAHEHEPSGGADAFKGPAIRAPQAGSFHETSQSEESNASKKPEGPTRVGVWVYQTDDSGECFVRVNSLDPHRLWAEAERIPAKGPKKRVVLLGESVARGFLYDPDFNCAMALDHLLRAATGSSDIEVVDLAQNGMVHSELLEIAEKAVALQPDAYLVFAGNNWQTALRLSPQTIAKNLRETPTWYDSAVPPARSEEVVQALVARLAEISARHSIPVLFVIPEFNALDWQSYSGWRDPLTVGDRGRAWRSLRSEAEKAAKAGDYRRLEPLARSMIEAGYGNPGAYEWAAICAYREGNRQRARGLIDQAGEVGLRLPFFTPPRCCGSVREALRAHCRAFGITVVDLSSNFSEFLDGALPDRTLFLDFCHMTAKGIWLAMASAAEFLLPLFGKPARSWRELNSLQLPVDPLVNAQAHFKAAIVNADRGQRREIVDFHFKEAIRTFPQMREFAYLLADSVARKL